MAFSNVGLASASFNFDMLNFNPADDTAAQVAINGLSIDYLSIKSSDFRSEKRFEFETDSQGWSPFSSWVFDEPSSFTVNNGLEIAPGISDSCFGGWGLAVTTWPASNVVMIEPGQIYWIRFQFESNALDSLSAAMPTIRAMAHSGDYKQTTMVVTESTGNASLSPTISRPLITNLFFIPHPNSAGEPLLLAWDVLQFNTNDLRELGDFAKELRLKLGSVEIFSAPLPAGF